MHALMPTAAGFLLVVMRCAALCSVAPLFGTRSVPAMTRMALALALAVSVFMGAGAPVFVDWAGLGALAAAATVETLIGLSAGLAARFAIEAASAAGHAAGLAMGLGFGSMLDPFNGAESTAISQILSLMALGVAVGAGIHRDAVAWLCRSVASSPPGAAIDIPALAAGVVGEAIRACALSVRLAFPVLAAVTFGHFALGLLSRAAPQLNLGNIGFSVAILAGGGALYVVAPGLAEMAANAARAAFVGG